MKRNYWALGAVATWFVVQLLWAKFGQDIYALDLKLFAIFGLMMAFGIAFGVMRISQK